ncbi:MAG: ABC transporter permease, partial [Planctomycetes bacterium]|nr:ABC transporter permease [Planctomycetota bacterium]
TLCLIIGGIDLSVGALCAVASTYCAGLLANYGLNTGLALVVGIGMATAMGTVNGLLISRTSMPPFIVTLSMMQAARGVAYIYSAGKPIRTPTDFGSLANGYLFDVIPYPIIVMLVVMVVMLILLNKTRFGRSIYTIGGNREAARFSGIDVRSTTLWVYIISGLLCGICGVIWASRLYSGQPTLGSGAEMNAIASAIVGGTSMAGGSGTIGGTLLGAFVIQTLTSGLEFLDVPFYYKFIVQGAVIIIAVYIDIKRKEIAARKHS